MSAGTRERALRSPSAPPAGDTLPWVVHARTQRGDVSRDDQRGGDDAAAVQARRQRQQRQLVYDAARRARRDGGQEH